MEGAVERKLSVGRAARTSLSHSVPASFEFCRGAPGDLTSGARLLEVRVRRIVHRAGMTWFFFDFTSAHGAAS